MSQPIKDFMTSMPHSVGHDMTTAKAMAMMQQHSCHHLPVLDGGELVGIVSDRDLRMVEKLPNSSDIAIEDIMTDEPVVVQPSEDVFQVVMLMHQKRIGSVIVAAHKESPLGNLYLDRCSLLSF